MAHVRRAGIEDAEEIGRLLHDFNAEFGDPTPEPAVLAERALEMIPTQEIFVLLSGDAGIALMCIRRQIFTGEPDAYLQELYVVPDKRGRGLGRELLEASMELAREHGATHFELTTSTDDAEARSLYESAGFTNREGSPDGPVMLYYERDL